MNALLPAPKGRSSNRLLDVFFGKRFTNGDEQRYQGGIAGRHPFHIGPGQGGIGKRGSNVAGVHERGMGKELFQPFRLRGGEGDECAALPFF